MTGTHASTNGTAPEEPPRPPPGQPALVMLGLGVGVLLMAIQLWLLTVALNLYLLREERGPLLATGISGLIFLGGVIMLRVLRRRPRRRV
ncbi:MAG TPA: hypothetical protein VFS33_10370 [Gemmatimonadales bacterium]|nr:hypothetical protein [Gemmatimonadales bacterium]